MKTKRTTQNISINNTTWGMENIYYYQRELSRYPIIKDRAVIAELHSRWKNSGDRQAYEQLVYGTSALVIRLALSYADKGVSIADLLQEGFLVLIEKLDKFDPKLGSLATYLTMNITEYLDRMIGRTDGKHPYQIEPTISRPLKLVNRAINTFVDRFGYQPSTEEIHAWIHTMDDTGSETHMSKNMDVDKVKICQNILNEKKVSIDEVTPGGRTQDTRRSLHELLSDQKHEPTSHLEAREELNLFLQTIRQIEEVVEQLRPSAKTVAQWHWFEGKEAKEIASHLGITRQGVHELKKGIIRKLSKVLSLTEDEVKNLLQARSELIPGANAPTRKKQRPKSPDRQQQVAKVIPLPTAILPDPNARMPATANWKRNMSRFFIKKSVAK